MAPVTTRDKGILAYIQKHPDEAVESLLTRFPKVDPWTVRSIRRQVRRDLEYADLDDGEATAEPVPVQNLTKRSEGLLRSGWFRPVQIEIRPRTATKPIFKKAGQTTLVLSDIHAPEHDEHAVDVALQIGQALATDRIIIAGDGMDCHALSKYTPAAHRPFRWVDERVRGVPVFGMIREMFPKTPIDYLLGNHDIRPEKFIGSQAPQLQGLFTVPQILGLDGFGFTFPADNRVLLADGKLLVIHGTKVRGEAGASVMAEVREAGMSVIMGHVHRRALYEVTRTAQKLQGEQPLIGVELGCLCNLQPDYLEVERTANWQHGAAVVTEYDKGEFDIELIRINYGRAKFRGLEFHSRVRAVAA